MVKHRGKQYDQKLTIATPKNDMKNAWIAIGALTLSLLTPLCFAANETTRPLSKLVFHPELSAPAEVVSYKNSTLSSEISGTITRLLYLVGEPVKQGDLLITIDDRNYQLSLKQSQAIKQSLEAKIKFAQYQLKQAKRLSTQRNVSEERVLQRESELESLLAQLRQQDVAIERAKIELARTKIKAPFSGVIVKRLINDGELASPGTPLIQLLANDAVEVAAQLHPHDTSRLGSKSLLLFTTPSAQYPVKVRRIIPLQDPRQRTQEVRLTFQADRAIAGTAGRLVWQHTQPHIPASLLIRRDGQLGLFTAREGKAHFIALPEAQEGRAPPVSQLPLDEMIIVEGQKHLQNGDKLEIK